MIHRAGTPFGGAVAQARRDRGWTQTELARITGLARRTISRIENGARPAPDSWRTLAEYLEIRFGGPVLVARAPRLVAVGELLRCIRQRNPRLSLREAAASLQISVSQLSRLERGQAAPRQLFDVGEEGDYELRENGWRSIYYERYKDEIADIVSGDGLRRGAFRRI